MKNNRGFTMIEISMVMLILGVMAALTLVKYNSTVAHNELEKASWNLLQQLSGARGLALRNDAAVLIRFSAAACTIYVDTSGDGNPQEGERQSVYKLPPRVQIGIASGGPTTAPTGIPFHSSGIATNWNTMLTVGNDAIGTINTGAVYIRSSRLPKFNYCIGMASTMQSIKLFKWSGSTWLAL